MPLRGTRTDENRVGLVYPFLGAPAVGPRPSTIWCREPVTEPGPDRDAHPNLSPPHLGEHPEQSAPTARSAGGRRPAGRHVDGRPACAAAPAWMCTRRRSSPASCRTGPDGREQQQVRSFGTTTAELLELADWLAESGRDPRRPWNRRGSTGSRSGTCWRAGFELMLVNARHIKQVPGRKTDVKDAEWIAQLLQHGLLRPSFVPPRADPRAARPDAAAHAAGPRSARRRPTGSRRCWRTPTSSWPAWRPTSWAPRAGR